MKVVVGLRAVAETIWRKQCVPWEGHLLWREEGPGLKVQLFTTSLQRLLRNHLEPWISHHYSRDSTTSDKLFVGVLNK